MRLARGKVQQALKTKFFRQQFQADELDLVPVGRTAEWVDAASRSNGTRPVDRAVRRFYLFEWINPQSSSVAEQAVHCDGGNFSMDNAVIGRWREPSDRYQSALSLSVTLLPGCV